MYKRLNRIVKLFINDCDCGCNPIEKKSEMFRDCTCNYWIECPKCGKSSIKINLSYYSPRNEFTLKENDAIKDWNKKQKYDIQP